MIFKNIFILLIFVFFADSICAAPVGIMEVLQGEVKITGFNQPKFHKKSRKRINIYNGDEIQTGRDTQAVILLIQPQDRIILFSNTLFILEEVTNRKRDFAMLTGKGNYRVARSRSSSRSNFRLRTTNANIAIRAARFIVGIVDNTTNVLMVRGKLTLAEINYPDVEIDLLIDQASRIVQVALPTNPVLIPKMTIAYIEQGESADVFEFVKFGKPVTAREVKKSQSDNEKASSEKEPADQTTTSDDDAEASEQDEKFNE